MFRHLSRNVCDNENGNTSDLVSDTVKQGLYIFHSAIFEIRKSFTPIYYTDEIYKFSLKNLNWALMQNIVLYFLSL